MHQNRSGILLLAVLVLSTTVHSQPAPAPQREPTYAALRDAVLSGGSVPVQGLHLQRDAAEIVLDDGHLYFAAPINGKNWLAVFRGNGHVRLVPANTMERDHLRILAGSPQLEALEDKFQSAVFVWTDKTYDEMTAGKTPTSEAAPGDASHDLGDFRNWMHKDLFRNFELRVLQDLLSTQPAGFFLACIKGDRSSKQFYVVDPRGASPSSYGLDEVGLYDAREREGGWWYLTRTKEQHQGGRPLPSEDRSPFVPVQVRVDTNIDKDETLHGTAKIQLRAREEGHRVVVFSLAGKLRVREAKLSDGTALPWLQEDEKEGSALGVVLPQPSTKDGQLEVQLGYDGKGVLDDVGEGNFSVGARTNWYPSFGLHSQYANYELGFCVPKDLDVIAVGELVSNEKKDNKQCTQWRSVVPIAVAGFNYGKFKKLEQNDPDSNLTVQVWRNPGTPDWIKELQMALREADSQASRDQMDGSGDTNTRSIQQSQSFNLDTGALSKDAMADAINSLHVYTAYFGSLPFTRIGVTQQLTGFEGQAWPTLVYLPFTAFLDSYQRNQLGLADAAMTDFIQEVGPHEVAHQWWGHVVGARTYHEQWMVEGFADFSAGLQLEKASGPERGLEFWNRARHSILGKTQFGNVPNDAGPIYLGQRLETFQNRNSYRLMIYPKGGFVLHMLRMMMQGPKGEDEKFIAMMKEFAATYRSRTASTADFQAIVEKHMTKEMDLEKNHKMDWFFQQWVYGSEVPTYQVDVKIESAGNGQTKIHGSMRQVGVSETFRTLVPIYLDLGNGRIARVGRAPCVGSKPVPLDVTLPIPSVAGVKINARYDVLAYDVADQ